MHEQTITNKYVYPYTYIYIYLYARVRCCWVRKSKCKYYAGNSILCRKSWTATFARTIWLHLSALASIKYRICTHVGMSCERALSTTLSAGHLLASTCESTRMWSVVEYVNIPSIVYSSLILFYYIFYTKAFA